MTDEHPALAASRESWRCVQEHDKEGWLALMADSIHIEDPIGPSVTNPDGKGIVGKEAVAAFYDQNIAANRLTITTEETFRSSSPTEIAHILKLESRFEGGLTSSIRGIFTYEVDDTGHLVAMRGYWHMDDMVFGQDEPEGAEGAVD
jgi:steroid Delta-isomerase